MQIGVGNNGGIDFDSLLPHTSSREWIRGVLCTRMGTREKYTIIRGTVSLGKLELLQPFTGILPSPGPQPTEETVTTVPERMLPKSPLLCWTSHLPSCNYNPLLFILPHSLRTTISTAPTLLPAFC